MNRILASLSTATLIAGAAIAQCTAIAPGATNIGSGDDTLFATTYALAAPFTMAGSAGTTTWTHFRACTNGWIALCDSTGTLTDCPSSTSYGSVLAATATSLYGPAGSNPRLMPYWGDLNSTAANAISYSTSGNITMITWFNVGDYPSTTGKSFAIELDSAAGTIKFHYSGTFTTNSGTKYTGFSPSNGTGVTAVNLFPGPTTSLAGGQHESFSASTIDLAGKTLTFTPAGADWNGAACTGAPATNVSYGTGCYTIPGQSFYQSFADAGLASAGLTGNAMNLSVAGNGYVATWLPGAAAGLYIPPSGSATLLAGSDDGDSPVVFPPLTVPNGTFSGTATLAHNGIVTLAGVGNNSFDYTPTGPELAAATGEMAFYVGWHDWNDTETGSGAIKTELVGGIFCITWDGVESYAAPVELANPGTQQIQFNLATGSVNYVWTNISPDITSVYGSAYVVGWKPTGATVDGGSLNLSTALPGVFSQTVTPMVLSAAPTPISTGVSGTLMTYTMSNIPSFSPPLPVYFAVTILSVSQNVAGIPLAGIGMPGCNLYLNSLDIINTAVPPISGTNLQTTQFFVPPGAPYGFQFFAQAAAFVNPPFTTPAGINTFGATVSNAIASTVSTF